MEHESPKDRGQSEGAKLNWPLEEAVAPPEDSTFSPDASLRDIVVFFVRHWLPILGMAVVTAAIIVTYTVFFTPQLYEASGTLLIVPPKYSSELKPSVLSVQGYKELLESASVVLETKKRLASDGTLDQSGSLRVGSELTTEIFVSRKAEETSLAPILRFAARSTSPQKAEAIASTWAAVFLEQLGEMMGGATTATVKFIEEEYPRVLEDLVAQENAEVEAANSYQDRYIVLARESRRKLLDVSIEATNSEAAHQAETLRLVEQFKSESNLDQNQLRHDALRTVLAEQQEEAARTAGLLDKREVELTALKDQLARTPRVLVLKKAITDQALWSAQVGGGEPVVRKLEESSLATEELNPTWVDLADRVSYAEVEANVLGAYAQQLEAKLEDLGNTIKALERDIGDGLAGLEKLKRERQAELFNLREQNDVSTTEIEQERDQQLDQLQREWDTRIRQLQREIEQKRLLFTGLAEQQNEAIIARGLQEIEDVRLGSPAVAPNEPISRGLFRRALLGLILGGVFGVVFSLSRQHKR